MRTTLRMGRARWRRETRRTAFVAAISAACAAGLAQACTNKDVVGVQVGSVSVQPPNITLFEGDSTTLAASVRDVEGSTLQNAAVTWSGAPTSVIAVDENGKVKGLAIGEAQVTAEFQGVKGTAQVDVIKGPTIEVEPPSVTFLGGVGAPAPAPASVDVGNSGGGTLGGLEATVEYAEGGPEGWLEAELAAAAAPTELTLTPESSGLPVGTHTASVVLSSPVARGGPVTVEVTLALTGLAIVESEGGTSVDETGTTDTIAVSLMSAPAAEVVLDVASGDLAEVTAAPLRLTFTPDDWDQAKEVVLTGVDDDEVDGTQPVGVTLSVDPDASDPAFHPIPDAVVTVAVGDDDGAGFMVDPTALSVDEAAGTGTFTVTLGAQPVSQVVLTVLSSDEGEAVTDASTLTFTAADWDPRTVTVTGVDDPEDDDDQTSTITVAVDEAASDAEFHGLSAQVVTVTTLDDDGVGMRIEESDGATVVGEDLSTDAFTVVLLSEPDGDVVVDVTSGDPGEASVDPTALTFTPADWNVPQTVTVTGVDDGLTDGDRQTNVTIEVDPVSTQDDAYDGLLPRTVTVTTLDDENAQVLVTETDGGTQATEGGAADQIRIRLSAEPVSNVVIDVASDNTADLTVAPTTLTFTPGNWDDPQTVAVTAVDELLVDGDRERTVTLTVNDAGSDDAYDGIVEEVDARTVDNDVAAFTAQHTNGSTLATEAGVTDTIAVRLSARPLTDVVLDVASDDPLDASVAPTSLTFTNASWDVVQRVVVTAVDDALIDGDRQRTITVAVNDGASDDAFDALGSQVLSAETVDDDQAGFTVDEIGGVSVQEDGGQDVFTVVLTAQPSSQVVLTLSWVASELDVDPATLTFTPANWDDPRTVTVTGVPDDTGEGDQSTDVEISVDDGASDDAFDGVAAQVVRVETMDDDNVGFQILELVPLDVTEAGSEKAFGVSLNTEPLSQVVLTVTSADVGEVTVSPTSLTFLPGSGKVPQGVTVKGQDDFVDDGDVVTMITVAVNPSLSEPQYDTVTARTVNATTRDDDTAGFTLTETGGSTRATEGGGADQVSIVLTSQPIEDVVIDVRVDQPEGRDPDAAVTPLSVTFTGGNWNVPQAISFSALDDDLVDGDLTRAVTFEVDDGSSDDAFHDVPKQTVTATTVDDDAAGFTLAETGGGTTVDESASTDQVTVVLDAEPDDPVTIMVSSSDIGEATVAPGSITFTAADWNVARTVTVTGVDDGALVDGNQQSTITFSVDPGSDGAFVDLPDGSVPVTTVDLDVAGFSATAGPTGTNATEGGATGSIQVVLTAQPVTNVVFTISSDDPLDATVSPAQLTFTNGNWSVPQTVTITAVDDPTVDGPQDRIITVAVNDGASNGAFAPLPNQTVAATTTDNDVAGFSVTVTDGTTVATEGGAGDTFTVVLRARPLSNVVFDISTSDPTDATVTPTTLTFIPTNWNVAQTVTFSAVNDAMVDGTRNGSVTISVNDGSSDNAFDALADSVLSTTTNDDDSAGFIVTETGATSVTEGGSDDTFTIVLTAMPEANVVMTITNPDPGEVSVDPSTITFTPANWATPRTVTVTGQNDAVGDGDQVTVLTISSSSTDVDFDALADQTVQVTTIDDDGVGLTITEVGSTSVNESGSGNTDDFAIVLTAQPVDPVVLTVTSADPGEAVTDSTTLTFTSAAWNVPKTVIVTGVDDDVDDGDQVTPITIAVNPAASDAAFDTVSARVVSVTTRDDDTAGFTLSRTTVAVTEAAGGGHTATFTAVLDAQPLTNVVLAITSSDEGEATVNPASLMFTNANWNVPQTVTVTGVDDNVVDGAQQAIVTIAVDDAASDNVFDAVADQTVTSTTADDDVAGFTLSQSALAVDEAGVSDQTFTVVLTSQPVANVVLSVTANDATEVEVVSGGLLTFDATTWDDPQTVTIGGADDALDDSNVLSTVTVAVDATNQDPTYAGLGSQVVNVTTTDDDTAGFTLSQTALTVDEAGASDQTFTVVLTSQPVANVVLSVTANDASEVEVVSGGLLTFDATTWDDPQTVTIGGLDDALDDSNVLSTVTVAVDATNEDPTYAGLGPQVVNVTTTDDDTAGFTLSQTVLTVDEAGASDQTFTVVLTSQPVANVVLSVTANDASEVEVVSGGLLTFDATTWDDPQTVTIGGLDDALDDSNVVSTVTVAVDATNQDPTYAGLGSQVVNVTTTDDDTAGFTLSQTVLTVDEAGASDQTFTVVLTSQPVANVVLSVTANDASEVEVVGGGLLTFDATTWDDPQTVTIGGADDALDDSNVLSTVTVAVDATNQDPIYAGLGPQVVNVTTTDDDTAGFTLSQSALAVDEAGVSDQTFTVVLTSQPVANVVLSVTANDASEVEVVGGGLLTFDATTWDDPQTVTIGGLDDALDDSDVVSTVTVAVDATNQDPIYAGLGPQVVNVTTTDDDTAGFTLSQSALTVDEAGASDQTFTVVLTSQPVANVVLSVTANDATEVEVVSGGLLTFDATTWDDPQTVTIGGADDALDDSNVVSTVTVAVDATNQDPTYAGLGPQVVNVTTTDDDTAGFTLSQTVLTVDEAGASDQTFTVVLTSQPVANVVLSVTANDASEVEVVGGGLLTFDATTWDDPQTVTIGGLDDALDDSDVVSTVTIAVDETNQDPTYAGLGSQVVNVTTIDDEVATLDGGS